MGNIELEKRYGTVYVRMPALVAHDNANTWSTSYTEETVRVPLVTVIELLQLLGVKVNLDDGFYKKMSNL